MCTKLTLSCVRTCHGMARLSAGGMYVNAMVDAITAKYYFSAGESVIKSFLSLIFTM